MQLRDVTLREAAQLPDRSYTRAQRQEAGEHLAELAPAFIQAGFPATGSPDPAVVRDLAASLNTPVTALARPLDGDLEAAFDTDPDVVDLFAPLSDRQLTHSINTSLETVVSMLIDAHDRVQEQGFTPHVSLVDAFRTETSRLVDFSRMLPGATPLFLADTVGCRTPDEVRGKLSALETRGVDLSRVGVHFHDDIGVATANVLAAAGAGVGYADVSVASLGERAGNPALEEVVVSAYLSQCDTFGIDRTGLIPTCTAVLEALGETVGDRKAIVGETVTTHESGIHTEAMLAEPSTFEPFDPKKFGGSRTLLFGEQTGESGAAALLDRIGIDADPAEFLALLREQGPLTRDEASALARQRFDCETN